MSGVYIKGMEMPESCTFCELYDYDNYWCNLEKRDVEPCYQDKPSSFCPLIPVPDHGRLIIEDGEIIEDS